MDIQIVSAKQREKLFSSHPAITKEYLMITPAINKAYSTIRDRVWMRSTGTFMHAMPRMGKSSCVEVVRMSLMEEFPDIFIVSFSAAGEPETKGMFYEILYAENLILPPRPTLQMLTTLLQTHIETNIINRGGKQFVLMIDEMQCLTIRDLRLLQAIHNRLDIKGIRMTTLGFAQPSILNLYTALRTESALDLTARFLCEPIPFDGCAAREDLREILTNYDSELVYPKDSNLSFTEFFVPQAYANGFRLASYAAVLWKQLSLAAQPLGTGSIPMEHLTRTAECILLFCSKIDKPKLRITARMVDEAIKESNLKTFSQTLSYNSKLN